MTIGIAKTALIGKILTAASTEDGGGLFNIDTSGGAFTTTLAAAVTLGQTGRYKQSNGTWQANAWTLTSAVSGGLKFINQAGVSVNLTSFTFNTRSIGEVVTEWDGSFFEITMLEAALGGFLITTPLLPVTTQNTFPTLPTAWDGIGVPTATINGVTVNHATPASTASTAASTTNVIAVTSAAGITVGEAVSGTGVPAGTTVSFINGLNITVSQAVNIANAANITFTPAVQFTPNSTSVIFNSTAFNTNLNPGDAAFATYNT